MSEYKRWIAYVYSYENDEKKNNVGYIKIEIRGKKTKISVHINVLSVTEPMKVYLYHRTDKVMQGIYIGDIVMDKGVGQCVYTLDTILMPDNINVAETCGAIIYCSDDKFFATEWDDIPISINEFHMSHEAAVYADEAVSAEEETPDIDIAAAKEPLDETFQESEIAATCLKEEYTPEDNNIIEYDNTEGEKDIITDNKIAEIENAAEVMLETYPRMFPFENDDVSVCVRIEPQDIGRLPIDTWYIANNSFLLHGYYSYRHLILFRTGDGAKPVYIIGVPGIYHNRDEYMAEMFGFGLFRPMKDCRDVRGEFGYWCISLTDISDSKKYR